MTSFIHPNDPHWHTLEFTETGNGAKSSLPTSVGRPGGPESQRGSNTYSKYRSKRIRSISSSPGNRPRRRSTPLISQADMFLQCKVEADAEDPMEDKESHDRDQGVRHTHSQRDRERDGSQNVGSSVSSRAYQNRSYLGVKRPEHRSGSDRTKKGNNITSRWVRGYLHLMLICVQFSSEAVVCHDRI